VEPDYLPDSEVFFSAMFIPHEDFTPRRMYTPPRGECKGGFPPYRVQGAIPLAGGSGGKWSPRRKKFAL
jgi:hypothetical protein